MTGLHPNATNATFHPSTLVFSHQGDGAPFKGNNSAAVHVSAAPFILGNPTKIPSVH